MDVAQFEDSDFVVTFTGECPDTRVIRTWDRVMAYIDFAMGSAGEDWASCREKHHPIHDADCWTNCDIACEDQRHIFGSTEIDECVYLRIERITTPIPETLLNAEVY